MNRLLNLASRSIARRLTVSLVATVCVVSCIAMLAAYRVILRAERAALEQRADQTIAYLAGSLDAPMWAVDHAGVVTVGAALSSDPQVASLIIRDERGVVLYSAQKPAADGTAARSADVFHGRDGERRRIGDVSIALSADMQGVVNRHLLLSSLLTIGLILLAIVAVAIYYIRAALKGPVKSLNEIVATFAAGDYAMPPGAMPYVEFQPFSQALADMAARIQEQIGRANAAEEKYRSIFDNAVEGIFQTSLDGRLLNANPALARIIGCNSLDQLMAQAPQIAASLYADPGERDRFLALLSKQGWVSGHQVRFRRIDGRLIWVAIGARMVFDADGKPSFIEGLISDITDQKQAEDERKVNLHFSESMDRVHRALQASDDIEQAMRDVLDVVLDIFQCDRASLLYPYDPGVPSWRVPMERTRAEFPGIGTTEMIEMEMTPQAAAVRRAVLASATPLRLGVGTEFPIQTYGHLAQGLSGIVMALRPKSGKPWGFMIQQCSYPRYWTRDEERLFQEIGRRFADGLTSLMSRRDLLQSEAELLRLNTQLRTALLDGVSAVAATVEMRDPYTAGHQRRVSQLATAIARELGLPAHQIEGIHLAGVVHDVGKIKIPAETLSKPGKLSALEFALIKEHARSGYDILQSIDFPWPIADIVLQHHERRDGSGYPLALAGDAILIEAQILAVADVVEAMMSDRPYRPGLGIDAALEEISVKRGMFFEEGIVDACVCLFRDKGFSFEALENRP
jgi:PAS domain S-box-containing protein/putative nucleotidyltransferase with HDIG domain